MLRLVLDGIMLCYSEKGGGGEEEEDRETGCIGIVE